LLLNQGRRKIQRESNMAGLKGVAAGISVNFSILSAFLNKERRG
jgi:hypothetical protein